MIKKKAEKKIKKKKDNKKKKKKILKKKEAKKKDQKKKLIAKKLKKNKEKKTKDPIKKKKSPKTVVSVDVSPTPVSEILSDHSVNYNVRDALSKLRALQNQDQVRVFTEGDKRLTITKAIPPIIARLNK